jgi:hypothetical protein
VRERLVERRAVIAQAIKACEKAMHDRQQVLNHFRLGRESFLVEHKQSSIVLGTRSARYLANPKRTSLSLGATIRWDICRASIRSMIADEFRLLAIEVAANGLDMPDIRRAARPAQKSSRTRLRRFRSSFAPRSIPGKIGNRYLRGGWRRAAHDSVEHRLGIHPLPVLVRSGRKAAVPVPAR